MYNFSEICCHCMLLMARSMAEWFLANYGIFSTGQRFLCSLDISIVGECVYSIKFRDTDFPSSLRFSPLTR